MLPLLALVLFGVYLGQRQREQQQTSQAEIVDCAPWIAPCELLLGQRRISLSFSEQPKPLTVFQVVTPSDADAWVARLDMEGMDMGLNQYHWRASDDGGWVADLVLPVCVTGRRDWLMTLSDGQSGVAVLRFETR